MNNPYGDLAESMEQLYESMYWLKQLVCLGGFNASEIIKRAADESKSSILTFQEALDKEIEKLEYILAERMGFR